MPLINIIPGDKIPVAPMNVRLPAWRLPGWLLVLWWLARGVTRLVVVVGVRYWWLTCPALAGLWIRAEYGWLTLALVVAVLAAGWVSWWRWHPASWGRFGWFPLLARWRALWVYRRRWPAVLATCGLATVFAGDRYVPRLVGVRCDRYADKVTVRMLPGQIPDDWARAAERLAYAFRLRDGRAHTASRADRVVLRFGRRDPLHGTVGPLPVPTVPDLTALVLGVREDGQPYRLRLAASFTHVHDWTMFRRRAALPRSAAPVRDLVGHRRCAGQCRAAGDGP